MRIATLLDRQEQDQQDQQGQQDQQDQQDQQNQTTIINPGQQDLWPHVLQKQLYARKQLQAQKQLQARKHPQARKQPQALLQSWRSNRKASMWCLVLWCSIAPSAKRWYVMLSFPALSSWNGKESNLWSLHQVYTERPDCQLVFPDRTGLPETYR